MIQDPEDIDTGDIAEEQVPIAGVMRQPLTYTEALMNGTGNLVSSKN